MNLDFLSILLPIPTVLFSLSFHEAAHAFVAWKLGDTTARDLGRLTLNPLKHLDPIGALSMVIFHIGWAKPVPINPLRFKNPKKGMALTALAGPLSNLLLAMIGMIIFVYTTPHLDVMLEDGYFYYYEEKVYQLVIYLFLYYFYYLNLVLTVFNLLPIPPFDGSRIFLQFLPEKVYFSVMKYERKIMLGFFAFYLIANTVERLTGVDINFISMGIRWVISYLEKGLMAVFRHLPFAQ